MASATGPAIERQGAATAKVARNVTQTATKDRDHARTRASDSVELDQTLAASLSRLARYQGIRSTTTPSAIRIANGR